MNNYSPSIAVKHCTYVTSNITRCTGLNLVAAHKQHRFVFNEEVLKLCPAIRVGYYGYITHFPTLRKIQIEISDRKWSSSWYKFIDPKFSQKREYVAINNISLLFNEYVIDALPSDMIAKPIAMIGGFKYSYKSLDISEDSHSKAILIIHY